VYDTVAFAHAYLEMRFQWVYNLCYRSCIQTYLQGFITMVLLISNLNCTPSTPENGVIEDLCYVWHFFNLND